MKNYNQELDDLFDKWEKESEMNGLTDFCRDGLLNKGKIFSQVNNEDGKTYWGRERGNENELWYYAERKILFLMKDTNGNPGEDMRYWIGRQHPTIITNRFFKNIALWFYGLTNIQKDGSYIPFEKANNQTDFSKTFDDLPISIVNLKKESGGARVSNEILLQYVGLISDEYKKYGDVFGNYLRRQVAEILNPNIIVCGGGSGTVLRIAKEIIYPKLIFKKANNWIYYNQENNKILIDSYHPKHTSDTDENVYEEMMKSMQQYYKQLHKTTI